MIGGFALFGQLSTLSGTPSPSASSCTMPQEPSLTSPCFWQVCGPRPSQVCCWPPGHSEAPAVHRTPVLTLQWPTCGQQVCPTGHAALVSAVQKVSLIRLHDPTARFEGRGFRQSVSVLPLHTAPRVVEPVPGTCAGL